MTEPQPAHIALARSYLRSAIACLKEKKYIVALDEVRKALDLLQEKPND